MQREHDIGRRRHSGLAVLAVLVLKATPVLAARGGAAWTEDFSLSLGELLKLEREHTPQVRRALANPEETRARVEVEQTGSGYWPQLSSQAGGEQRQAGLSLSQRLPNLPLWNQSWGHLPGSQGLRRGGAHGLLQEVQWVRCGIFLALSKLDRALGEGIFPALEARP
jgi:outer membrane protein TolC